jgi:saccharopine dehydrogenase-like NADP-dependent oxidoreductase
MRFLMHDLHLNEDRATLKKILEKSLPRTEQDVMLVYVSVTGLKSGNYLEQNYVKKIMPHEIYGERWSAIQVSTASSLCAVVDLVMTNPSKYKGFILQEEFSLSAFLKNRFGFIYNGEE